jgi:hypothetical protein
MENSRLRAALKECLRPAIKHIGAQRDADGHVVTNPKVPTVLIDTVQCICGKAVAKQRIRHGAFGCLGLERDQQGFPCAGEADLLRLHGFLQGARHQKGTLSAASAATIFLSSASIIESQEAEVKIYSQAVLAKSASIPPSFDRNVQSTSLSGAGPRQQP